MASARFDSLRRNAETRDLFNKQIKTIEGLRCSLESSSFIAIDTEHVAASSQEDRVLHQIGLVYIPALLSPISTPLDSRSRSLQRPCLQRFYSQHNGRALTLDIALSKHDQDRLVLHRGEGGISRRRTSRFGVEKTAPIEVAEKIILDFFQSLPADRPLVLLGFALAAEWTYLSIVFPGAMRFISAWVDVRDVAKDVVSSVGCSSLPGLSTLLSMFGYSGREFFSPSGKDQNHTGNADSAVEDAVAACALGRSLLFQDNQSKLVFYQKCARVARPPSKTSRCQNPNHHDGFSTTIRTKEPLPHLLETGNRVAGQFLHYCPTRAGVMSHDTAYLAFKTRDEREQFIEATNGRSLPTGEVLTTQACVKLDEVAEREMEMRKAKRQLREAKWLEFNSAEASYLS